MIGVLIADDQPLVRTGLRMILGSAPDIDVVGEAADGLEAADLARSLRPDVVLMDVRMPHVDGIAATRRVVAQSPGTKVLILTTFDRSHLVYDALVAGASGFLLKDSPVNRLIDAVHAVMRGEELLAPSITRRLIEEFTRGARLPAPPGLDTLTDREHQVLVLVARGLSNAEIAADLYVSVQTVKTHVARILTKLGLRDRVQVVVAAYECGLVRPGE